MKKIFYSASLLLTSIWIVSCQPKAEPASKGKTDSIDFSGGYAKVNGIKLYYEMYGKGQPLVLIHGGGSTIQSSFGRVIPALAENHKVIAVELQNHGRSDQRTLPETFEQDAEDVFALMKNLNISKADFLGFSNGGHTLFELALRHPGLINKLIVASSPYKRSGFIPGFFESMPKATLATMPHELKTEFLKVNPDSARLQNMFAHDRDRMVNFEGWTDEQMKSITAPTLLINGDMDVLTPEHAVEMHRMLSGSQLVILPSGHGKYMGEITTLGKDGHFFDYLTPLVNDFLNTK